MTPLTKEAKFKSVAQATLRLLDKDGFDQLKMAQIAKIANVSRPWIYKYLGQNKETLVDFALKYLGQTFSGLDSHSDTSSVEKWIESQLVGFENGFSKSTEWPWILSLYFSNRGSPNRIGRVIDQIESQYLNRIQQELRVVFKLAPEDAKISSEIYLALKMGLNHHWYSSKTSATLLEAKKTQFLKMLKGQLSTLAQLPT